MARKRYNGLHATLGGSGLTSGATSVTFSAALTHSNGTNVPTLANSDYIPLAILDTSGNLSEIVHLTAYTAAGTTGTIARGRAGTTGVSHSAGDRVVCAPLAAEMAGPSPDNILDFNEVYGETYVALDQEFNAGGATSLPSGWSWVNQGSATYLERFGSAVIHHPGNTSDDLKMIVESLSGAPSTWRATAKFSLAAKALNYVSAGMVLRDSTTGRIALMGGGFSNNNTVNATLWSSATAVNSTISGSPAAVFNTYTPYFYIAVVKNSGTSYDFQVSGDGVSWFTFAAGINLSTYVATIDQIGIGVLVTGTSQVVEMSCDWLRVR